MMVLHYCSTTLYNVTMNFVPFHSDRSAALTSEEIEMMYERLVAGMEGLRSCQGMFGTGLITLILGE